MKAWIEKNHCVVQILFFRIRFKLSSDASFLKEVREKLANIEFKQNLLMDYYTDIAHANAPTGAVARRQKENLVILKEFARVCNDNGIGFWLDFGSLLGYKRHNGCIPWDDDIDVGMRVEEYNEFKSILKEKLDKKFAFWEEKDAIFGRLIYKDRNDGAFIDIFPYSDEENGSIKVIDPYLDVYPYYVKPVENKIMFPLKKEVFYGIEVNVPNKTDTYLRFRYGNYNLLPKKAHSKLLEHTKLDEHIPFEE